MTLVSLTKTLIELPSYVDSDTDETAATDYLVDYLGKLFPEMVVEKQYIDGSLRCNVILRGRGEIKLFALGHIDTVQPKQGWATPPLEGVIKNGRLYGLGASDMKGSLPAFLWALMQERQGINLDNLMVLIYVDEEYDFRGIKYFVDTMAGSELRPELTLSLDGKLEVGSGCRGLIEVNLLVKGRSGHSSNPANGVSAITRSIDALQQLDQELRGCIGQGLGATTMNIAYMRGGATQVDESGVLQWLTEGNIIPDTAKIVVEVRPSVLRVNADLVVSSIKRLMGKAGLVVSDVVVRHDISPWPSRFDDVSLARLKRAYARAGVAFKKADSALLGYIDAQMVAEKIKSPTYIIGTGGGNRHAANEYVPLVNLDDARRIYSALLREYLGNEQG